MIDAKEAIELIDKSGVVIIKWSTLPGVSAHYISDNISQFGYQPEDFYTGKFKDYWNFVHEDDRERVIKELYATRKEIPKTNTVSVLTYRVRCSNGEIRWVEESLLHDVDEHGINERGFLRDVTVAKNVVNKMRSSVEKYQYMMDNLRQFVFVLNTEDRIVSASPFFSQFTGLKEGDTVESFVVNEDCHLYDKLRNYYREYSELEFRINGEKVVFEVIAKLLDSGELLVLAENVNEIKDLRKRDKDYRTKDFMSGLQNYRLLENFINEQHGEGYRVVMMKIVDYKGFIRKNGFLEFEDVVKDIAKAIQENFSMYNEQIYRAYDDEFIVFTRSPINNIHIHRTNKRVPNGLEVQWGTSKRGVNLYELIAEARRNLKKYEQESEVGSIFGYGGI